MDKPKINRNEIIAAAQDKQRTPRKNVTFRLDTALYGAFEAECTKQKVKPIIMLETILEAFLGQDERAHTNRKFYRNAKNNAK